MSETSRPPLQGATLGQRIKAAYERAGLKRAAFARMIEVDYKTVINWEKGDSEPRAENLRRAADVTGFSVQELMGQTSERTEYDAATLTAVEEFLATPEGKRVTPEQAERLKRVRFGGITPTAGTILNVYLDMLAEGRGETPEPKPEPRRGRVPLKKKTGKR